ncbi:hypothetical protein [Mammaliicoccus lentus]|uniref:hypothetical protein n=1 Tax=Mammaliicoccus lentus TaxID=42858 RepID=UPI003CE76EA4
MPTIKHTRESIAKLEQERNDYKQQRDELIEDVKKLREALIKTQNLADELMDIQVKYMNLTEHIKNKAINNPSVSRYIDLVHFIDDLERDTHEG